jgi:hypothetical protein
MKVLIAAVLFALTSAVALGAEPHWVLIGSDIAVKAAEDHTKTVVYLDEANPLAEEGYNGFTVKWVLPQLSDGDTIAADGTHVKVPYQVLLSTMEYNCHTDVGRGKRTFLVAAADGTKHPFSEDWREIAPGSGAAAVLAEVKERACASVH